MSLLRKQRIRCIQVHIGADRTIPILRFTVKIREKEKAGGEKVNCFVTVKRQAEQGASPQEGRDGTLRLSNSRIRGVTKWYSAVRFDRRKTVSVVNLPRSSVGSGETIAQSRNSERCLRRLLPRDYINAFRRLRIGRCPPPFLTHRQMDVWNVTWGPLRVNVAYDYRKHPSFYFGKRIFRAARAGKRRREHGKKHNWKLYWFSKSTLVIYRQSIFYIKKNSKVDSWITLAIC